jgi:3-isopropylmalate/(R)-2-methylmalate dehydratase small subunit
MEPFTTLVSRAASFPRANVDTDQILPARFLHRPRATNHADFLFADLRQDPGFFLHRRAAAAARILVVGPGFGGGSSREGAVYALWDWGFRCLLGVDFGDIFHANCAKNGLLAVRLQAAVIAHLHGLVTDDHDLPELRVDLALQIVRAPGLPDQHFQIDGRTKRCLLEGLDEIGATRALLADIDAFAAARRAAEPWSVPPADGA